MRLGVDAQFLEEEFTDAPGIRLPTGRLHNRTDNDTSGLWFSAGNLLDHVGVGTIASSMGRNQRAIVGDNSKAPGRNDVIGFTLTGEDTLNDLARKLVVKRTILDQRYHPRDLSRRDRQCLKFHAFRFAIRVSSPGATTSGRPPDRLPHPQLRPRHRRPRNSPRRACRSRKGPLLLQPPKAGL